MPRLGDTDNHFAAANLVAESGLTDVRDLFLNAGCGGSAGTACAAETGTDPDAVYFRMYRAAITLQDDTDPVFTTAPSGSLTAGGALAGPQGVSSRRRTRARACSGRRSRSTGRSP